MGALRLKQPPQQTERVSPMSEVIESYEEEAVVTTSRRVVHVVEDVSAHIEAWHGGRKVDDLGGWTHVSAAVREARAKAKWFGVDANSTMSIVVREEISRSRMVGDKVKQEGRGETIGRSIVVAQRYVHDAVLGERMPLWRTLQFNWAFPVRFANANDCPGDDLKNYFRPVTVRDWAEEFLFRGYGYRDMKVTSQTARPARTAEIPKDRDFDVKPNSAYWVVEIEGTLQVSAPAGRDIDGIVADLRDQELELDVEIDWNRDGQRINRQRWTIWTGAPAAAPITWQGFPSRAVRADAQP